MKINRSAIVAAVAISIGAVGAIGLNTVTPAGAASVTSVPNQSEADMKADCEREYGGSFESGEDYYGCTHSDGSTTWCERDGGGCFEQTPIITTTTKPRYTVISTTSLKLAPLRLY